jgi:alpha-glucosidase
VDTLWLSPIHPSPNVDWGYDVADYLGVHPDYGTLEDLDGLIAGARARHIDVWLDLVPNHTSNRHRWFTDEPDRYVWSATVPNDWKSVFTHESAWTYEPARGQYYLHQFAPEQPDLDWWNPAVRDAFEHILRFWFDRGVAGFRIDVAHGLIKDRRLRNGARYLRDRPEVNAIYERWQTIAGGYDPKRTLMGETYVPLRRLSGYWQHLDLVQNFDFVNAPFERDELRLIVERTLRHVPPGRRALWFGSNHDHSRMATRWAGGDEARQKAALFLILTLPGVAILYQGDEIGLGDGVVPQASIRDVARPPRDPERTPMPWTRDGKEWRDPWLPLADTSRNVAGQRDDPDSILSFTRALIARRGRFSDDSYRRLRAPQGVWAYARGDATCILNMSPDEARYRGRLLAPWEGIVLD